MASSSGSLPVDNVSFGVEKYDGDADADDDDDNDDGIISPIAVLSLEVQMLLSDFECIDVFEFS